MDRLFSKANLLKYLSYVGLVLFSVVWMEIQHVSLWAIVLTSFPIIIADIFGDYNPKILAFIYTQRKKIAWAVMGGCLVISSFLYIYFPFVPYVATDQIPNNFILITQFLLEGAVVGLVIRMLLLNLFANILRAKDVHLSKVLILIAWGVFIIIFPIAKEHRGLSSVFVLGFGIGFLLHYIVRVQDKKDAQKNRLRQNIMALIEVLKNEEDYDGHDSSVEAPKSRNKLTQVEETAVDLYSSQKWKSLASLLHKSKETVTLFFIRLSMHRKLHQYETALGLIREKMEDIRQKGDASDYKSHEHFLHLHFALNESERFDHTGNWKNRDNIFNNLEIAHKINPKCLLTCATYALRLAGEIGKEKNDEKANNDLKNMSLELIWEAMKSYEGPENPKPVSLVTGMTVPVTYKFLMDTYGYVLLKNGMLRFAKALIQQCIYEDPTYSAAFLHHAEWFIEYYNNFNRKNNKKNIGESWKKAARLNLYIAIELEKIDDIEKSGSSISNSSKRLLKQLN